MTEIIEMLDLAVTHADNAGMSLPMLAGMGVVVVDSYRSVALQAIVADDDTPPAR